MRHANNQKKLNRTSSHRGALLMNLTRALIRCGKIQTTLAKAKFLRPFVEKLVTKAKNGGDSLHVKRQLLAELRDMDLVNLLCDDIAKAYKTRPGGYTRILKTGNRYGDMAPMAVISFVESA